MNIESVRQYCLSLPMVTEDNAFGDDCLLFRICDKIFACISFEQEDFLALKCNPDYALDLRDRHIEIAPAWHWNKKYWNQMNPDCLSDSFIQSLIRHSYSEVVKKLTKKIRTEYPDICKIKGDESI